MNNGDMPISPILGDTEAYVNFLDGIKGGNNYGLKKREYFAGLAMQGMLSNTDEFDTELHKQGLFVKAAAQNAVQLADALLKELEK